MKAFNFQDPIFLKRSADRQAFYKVYKDVAVTEDQFVNVVASWVKKTLHNRQSRGASAARREYRKLVKLYGFFPGGQSE